MNHSDAKDALYDIVSGFFPGATVIWAEQKATTPKPPYITLKMKDETPNSMPIVNNITLGRYYQCTSLCEINLYTKGALVGSGENAVKNYRNTALEDMADFFMYLDSDYGYYEQKKKEITIILNPPIRDLSSLENDAAYRYRALAEFEVKYVRNASGPYGVRFISSAPNSSGGATAPMVEKEDEEITKLIVKEE